MLAGMFMAAITAMVVTAPYGPIAETWDFDDGSMQGWVVQEGEWRADESKLVHADMHRKGALAGRPDLVLDDFTLEADVAIVRFDVERDTVWAGVAFRASCPVEHGAWHDGYLAFIRANGSVELVHAGGAVLAANATSLRPHGEVVRLKVAAKGARLRVSVNGEQVLDIEDPMFKQGEIALVNFGNVASFDNVRLAGNRVAPGPPPAVAPLQPAPVERAPVSPLPRIGIRHVEEGPGEFYVVQTGERFVPRGFNHTVLERGSSGWHATFNVGVYDSEAMDSTLKEMARLGANTIRVWAWGVQKESGFTGGPEGRGLDGAYMENVIDFVRLATKHRLYVVAILDEVPHNAYYDNVSGRTPSRCRTGDVTGYNRQYLKEGPIAAKAAAAADFVRYIRDADEGLLSAVLAWSLANEVFVNHTQGPFRRVEGMIATANGESYDMGDRDDRQRCYDESIVHWANKLTTSIKDVDAQALVTAGMWTADAHGRPPYNGLMPDDKDPRIPPRPSVLAGPESRLDFIEVHIYPWGGSPEVRREAHEWDAVMASGTPVLVGEYGVFKRNSIEEARRMLERILTQAHDMNYQGALFWAWDLTAVEGQTWSAVEHGLGAFVMERQRILRDIWMNLSPHHPPR